MENIIRLDQTIFEISQKYPEVVDIMAEIGFKDITNPKMLKTVGKYMTIGKGTKLKNKDLDDIKEVFKGYGFEVI